MLIKFDKEDFQNYYKNQFQQDLIHYFKEYRNGNTNDFNSTDGYLFVKYAKAENTRFNSSATKSGQCYFTVCMIYLQAFVHVFFDISQSKDGDYSELWKEFVRCTGYPVIILPPNWTPAFC
jgi:hypothetical protein